MLVPRDKDSLMLCVSQTTAVAATPGSSKTDRKSSVKVSKYLLTAPVIHKSFACIFQTTKTIALAEL